MVRNSAVLFLTCSALLASNNPIGLATVTGTMHVDSSDVRDNATILEGTSLETDINPSQIALKSGVRLELAAESSGKVYANRLVLEKGIAQVHASSKYLVIANSMQVVPNKASTLRVGYIGDKSIEVFVVSGEARVLNSKGRLLASVLPNRAIELTPEENSVGGTSDPTNQPEAGGVTQSGASPGSMSPENKRAVIAGVSGAVTILTVAPLAMAGAFSGGKATPVSPQ